MKELTVAAESEPSAIDRLAEAASRREVTAGKNGDAVVREALIVGRARARAAAHRRSLRAGLAVALVALGALTWPGWRDESPPAATAAIERPGVIELAAFGHRIEALDGAALEALDEGSRWRLDRGAALFDVAPNGARDGFEVRTPDATVHVRGTVFGVSVDEAGTRVEVFEGRVEVRDRRSAHVLERGESYATHPSVRTVDSIVSRGERAARRREEEARPESDSSDPRSATSPEAPPSEAAQSEPLIIPSDDPRPRAIDLASLRAMCQRGEWERALEEIASARPPRRERGDWAMLEGDAHRALGHSREAASAYERAAEALTPTRAALAGYLAATQHERAGEHAAALAALEESHAADRGSPLEERALAMRASLLARAGRVEEARIAARAYLAAFPGGEAVPRMEGLARSR